MKLVYINGMAINLNQMATIKVISLGGDFGLTATEPDGSTNIFVRDLPSENYAKYLLFYILEIVAHRSNEIVLIDSDDFKKCIERVEKNLESIEKQKVYDIMRLAHDVYCSDGAH